MDAISGISGSLYSPQLSAAVSSSSSAASGSPSDDLGDAVSLERSILQQQSEMMSSLFSTLGRHLDVRV